MTRCLFVLPVRWVVLIIVITCIAGHDALCTLLWCPAYQVYSVYSVGAQWLEFA